MHEGAPKPLSKSALEKKLDYLAGKGSEKAAELQKLENEIQKVKAPYINKKISVEKQLKARHKSKKEAKEESERNIEVIKLQEAYEKVLHKHDKKIRSLKKEVEDIKGESMSIVQQMGDAAEEGQDWSQEEEELRRISTPPNAKGAREVIRERREAPVAYHLSGEQLAEIKDLKTFDAVIKALDKIHVKSNPRRPELAQAINTLRMIQKEGFNREVHINDLRKLLSESEDIPEEVKEVVSKFFPKEAKRTLEIKEKPDSFEIVFGIKDAVLHCETIADVKRVLKTLNQELATVADKKKLSSELRAKCAEAMKLEAQLSRIMSAIDNAESDNQKIKLLERIKDEDLKTIMYYIVFPEPSPALKQNYEHMPIPETLDALEAELADLEAEKATADPKEFLKITARIEKLKNKRTELLRKNISDADTSVPVNKKLEDLAFGPIPEEIREVDAELLKAQDLLLETDKDLDLLYKEGGELEDVIDTLRKIPVKKKVASDTKKLSESIKRKDEIKLRVEPLVERRTKINERIAALNAEREKIIHLSKERRKDERKRKADELRAVRNQARAAKQAATAAVAQSQTAQAAQQNAAPQKNETPEERVERHTQEIAGANTFEELFAVLKTIPAITHHAGKKIIPRDPKKVIGYIEEARANKTLGEIFKEYRTNHVPDYAGLEAKVTELFNKENVPGGAPQQPKPPTTSASAANQNTAPQNPGVAPTQKLLFSDLNLGNLPDTIAEVDAEIQGPLRELFQKLNDRIEEYAIGNVQNAYKGELKSLRKELALVNDRVVKLQEKKMELLKKSSGSPAPAANATPNAAPATPPQSAQNTAPQTPALAPATPATPQQAQNAAPQAPAAQGASGTPNAAPAASQNATSQNPDELKTADNMHAEIGIWMKELEQHKQGDPMHAQISQQISALTLKIDQMKGEWAAEERDARRKVEENRLKVVIATEAYEKSRGGVFRKTLAFMNPFNEERQLARLNKKLHSYKLKLHNYKPTDPKYKDLEQNIKELKENIEKFEGKDELGPLVRKQKAEKEWETQTKRLANAVAQGEWEIHKNSGGNVPENFGEDFAWRLAKTKYEYESKRYEESRGGFFRKAFTSINPFNAVRVRHRFAKKLSSLPAKVHAKQTKLTGKLHNLDQEVQKRKAAAATEGFFKRSLATLNPWNLERRKHRVEKRLSKLTIAAPKKEEALKKKIERIEQKDDVLADIRYRTAKREYDQAEAALAHLPARPEGERYEKLQAQLIYRQMEKVLKPESQKRNELQRERMLSSRDKGIARKIISIYTGMSKPRRIALGILVAAAPATLVSTYAFCGSVVRHVTRIAIGATLGTVSGKVYEAGKREAIRKAYRKETEELSKSFNSLAGTKDLSKLEKRFRKKYRNLAIKKAGVTALTSGAWTASIGLFDNFFFRQGVPFDADMKNALGGTPSDMSATAAAPSAEDIQKAYDQASFNNDGIPETPGREPIYTGDEMMDQFVKENGVPESIQAPAPLLEQEMPEQVMEKYVHENGIPQSAPAPVVEQVNPSVPEAPKVAAPETSPVRIFADDIEDKMRGSRVLRSDSAELSAKRIFENNAKELGYDRSSGMSVKRWAEMRVSQLVEEHPEIRNAITHNGNSIKLGFNPDGSVASVTLERGDGMMPTLKGQPIGVASAPSVPEEPTVEGPIAQTVSISQSDLPEPEPLVASPLANEDLFQVSPPSLDEISAHGQISPQMVTQAISSELPERVNSIFKVKEGWFYDDTAISDGRWDAVRVIPAEKILSTNFSHGIPPQFTRFYPLPKGVDASVFAKDLNNLKKVLLEAKADGLVKPRLSVDSVLKEMIKNDVIAGKILTARK